MKGEGSLMCTGACRARVRSICVANENGFTHVYSLMCNECNYTVRRKMHVVVVVVVVVVACSGGSGDASSSSSSSRSSSSSSSSSR